MRTARSYSKLFQSFTDSLDHNEKSKNIYLGIGVCTRSQLSVGIPFDILSLVLCGEQLRRIVNGKKVYYLIADTHALLTGHDSKKVAEYTFNMSIFLDNLINKLDIPHECVISSFIENIDLNKFNSVKESKKYMKAQMEDMKYFISHCNVGYKLGWKYNKKIRQDKNIGNDEFYFDKEAKAINIPLKYCYTQPGYTMHKETIMVSPYICTNPKERILFNDFDLDDKLDILISENSNSHKIYENFLREIQLLFCQLFYKPIKGIKPFVKSVVAELS